MKLLIINPNISESVTALIAKEAQRTALPDTSITTMTAEFGVAYIETPAEAAVAGYAILDLMARHHAEYDAVIIAAFGDPCLVEAKEILPIPVVGLTSSALASAFLLGGRFAIVGISTRISSWYVNVVEQYGMAARFVGYRGLGEQFADIGTVQDEAAETLLQMCIDCIDEGADAIIMAGAPLAGLARQIASQVSVPLIDGVKSAVLMAETMVRSNYGVSRQGALALPPVKPHHGMSPALSTLIGRQSLRGNGGNV